MLLLRVHGNSDCRAPGANPAPPHRSARARHWSARLSTTAALPPDIDAAVTARLLFGMVNSITEWLRSPSVSGRGSGWPTRWSRLPSTASVGAPDPARAAPTQAVPHEVTRSARRAACGPCGYHRPSPPRPSMRAPLRLMPKFGASSATPTPPCRVCSSRTALQLRCACCTLVAGSAFANAVRSVTPFGQLQGSTGRDVCRACGVRDLARRAVLHQRPS